MWNFELKNVEINTLELYFSQKYLQRKIKSRLVIIECAAIFSGSYFCGLNTSVPRNQGLKTVESPLLTTALGFFYLKTSKLYYIFTSRIIYDPNAFGS